MKKKVSIILSVLLLGFLMFLRLIALDKLPLGMHIDEAGLGLNAWSLANFGTDRYGNFLPVCPLNFYGEQSAFYSYFCAALVKLFGLSAFTLRLPGAIMGIVAAVFGALICKERFGEKGWFAGLALCSIFPYFILSSRYALDCNAMLGALTVAIYALLRLLRTAKEHPEKKYYGRFALVGVLFGIVLYTYIIAAIVIAIFCVLFGLWYLFLLEKEHRMTRFLQLCCMALPLCVLAVPLVLVVLVNTLGWDTITTPLFTVPRLITNRTEEIGLSAGSLAGKLRALCNILLSDHKYGSSNTYLTLYPQSILFVLAGGILSLTHCVQDLKRKELSIDTILLMLSFSEVVMFLFCGLYNYHINGIFTALAYFCVCGIFALVDCFKKEKLRKRFIILVALLYLATFGGFCLEYYRADSTVAFQVYGGMDEAVSLVKDKQKEGEIYCLDEVAEFYLCSNPISPSEFAQLADELGYIKDIQNLHFYQPESFAPGDTIICNKAMRRTFENSTLLYETAHYRVYLQN